MRMIRSFKEKEVERLFNDQTPSRKLPPDIQRTALRKLAQVDAAASLTDLAALPGNHLEPLKGDRQGQHSLRINKQSRICFVWSEDGNAHDVEICDYH